MTIFERDDKLNYKVFAIKQRLNELKKSLKRMWTQERQDEFDNLERDLNNFS